MTGSCQQPTELYRQFANRDFMATTVLPTRPFSHQVGGHKPMLETENNTLFKILIPREYNFYVTVPEVLRTFVPVYKGVVEVVNVNCRDKCNANTDDSDAWLTRFRQCSLNKHDSNNIINHLNKSSCKHFLILENLTAKFSKPCVLDLKMGTRHYGDTSPPDKVILHRDRCKQSTSHVLGVRACGMQVYHSYDDTWIKKDKYYGREIDQQGFKDLLRFFFCDGNRLLLPTIDDILIRLQELRKVISQMDTYRFYSCSLLLIYEGKAESRERKNDSSYQQSSPFVSDDAEGTHSKLASNSPVDVRLIDFAKTTSEHCHGDPISYKGPDTGFLFGLDNIIRLLSELKLTQTY